ncbi:flavin monoamine oxidase family protein [Enterococcus quebecensis]|uniref:Amine oxidase domain-containing protein n=1 Tax=Enterococcus quebecensis TaxID=903983 RepID=A0A1E5GU71_9ENTE|nr:FAD-dependent oxidoreductase [Enterococcus quebecensis]OEG16212.1 hypothetical protein BCR23_04810 [Enterococcus quebecensis]OJG74518.1 amine oxidase [Enterococcus quebecensis]
MNTKYDVVIVGAGFAGLSAGLALKEKGVKTCILEARDRAGGRAETKWLDEGIQIDLGGQWIGPTQDRMYELVEKYKMKTFSTQLFGKEQYYYYNDLYDQAPDEMMGMFDVIDDLAKKVNLEEPQNSPDINYQDRITLDAWLSTQTKDEEVAEFLGRILAGGLLASDAGEVSLFQMLYYIASGQGTEILLGSEGGAQQDRIVGGPQALANKMAEDYGTELKFNQVVRTITKMDQLYFVETENGNCYETKFVLMALPPSVINSKITFVPELPTMKKKMLQNVLPGSASKYHAVYDKPFWREKGLSGQFNLSQGWIMESIDNSNENREEGIITFFIYGIDSIKLNELPEEKRKQLLIKELVRIYGKEASEPKHFLTQDWNEEPFTNGCFTGRFAPCGFIKYGEFIRKETGGIHWAGTETATVWNGYFEGAVRSGEREAEKIVKKMK